MTKQKRQNAVTESLLKDRKQQLPQSLRMYQKNSKKMKLRVKNLGPIKQGEIDLSKRFFVFVGYNNTGKTYMAQVLWSVLMFWSDNSLLTRVYKQNYTFPDKLGIDKEWIYVAQPLLNYYQNELSEIIIQDFSCRL